MGKFNTLVQNILTLSLLTMREIKIYSFLDRYPVTHFEKMDFF